MKTLIDQSDLVAGSDYISLSRTMVLNQKYLVDSITNAHHKLTAKAAHMIELLEWPIPVELWLKYGYKLKLSNQNVLDIIFFLNDVGALEIRRGISDRSFIIIKQLKRLISGILPTQRSRRREPSFINICIAVLIAMQPLIIATVILAIISYGINLEFILIVMATTGFLVFIAISTVIHEWTHSLIIARNNTAQILIQRGLRIGILYRELPLKIELWSALLGPVSGALISIICGLFCGWMLNRYLLFMLLGTLVGGMQLISLLPAYGDGRVARDSIRRFNNDSQN
jgi:hypothetical protein